VLEAIEEALDPVAQRVFGSVDRALDCVVSPVAADGIVIYV
jgi:hypothetical protein